LSFYLGFEGEEMLRYSALKEVFKLMNHNDDKRNFSREIELFEKTTTKLNELF